MLVMPLAVAAPKPAQAQACIITGQVCSMLGDLTASLAQELTFSGVMGIVTAALTYLIDSLMNLLTIPALDTIIQQAWAIIQQKFLEIWQMIKGPANMDWARQWSVNVVDSVNMEGIINGAKKMLDAMRTLKDIEFKANISVMPSPGNICTFGTAMGAGSRMKTLKIFYRRAMNTEQAEEAGNNIGSMAENGAAQDIEEKRLQQHRLFCDPAQNNGMGCPPMPASAGPPATGDTPLTNCDIQPGYAIMGQDNVDVGNPDIQTCVKAVTDMVVEPVTLSEPVDVTQLPTSTRQIFTVLKRAHVAKQQIVYDALHETTADRIPGSGQDYINGIRGCNVDLPGQPGTPDPNAQQSCAGLPDDRTEPNWQPGNPDPTHDPSYREVIRALIKERWWNPNRFAEFSDNPAKIRREMVGLEAMNLIQQQDYYELMERLALLLAVQVSVEIDKQDINQSQNAGGFNLVQ